MNIFDKLESKNSSKIFCSGVSYSYKDLAEDLDAFGKHISNESLAFIICNNSYDFLVGYISFIKKNIPVAFINDNIHPSLLQKLIERFKPSYLYAPNSINDLAVNWKKIKNFKTFNLFKDKSEFHFPIHKDLCLMLMTSGSTGSPEFVRLSHKNLYSNTVSICQYLNINSTDIAITTMPSSYSFGISVINSHLFRGASLVLTQSSFMEKNFWDDINKFNVTTFSGVPFSFQMLKKLNFQKISIPSLNYITQAGGKLDSPTLEYFSEICSNKDIKFIVMYGQTEASPRMSYLPPEKLSSKINSIGIPIPGGRFELIDKSEEVVKKSFTEGELVFYGDNVCMGYASSYRDLELGDLNNGKLYTGDLAEFDNDNYFYITGRIKRFIKIYGNRISLDSVEIKLNSLGFECACIGSDDKLIIFSEIEEDCQKINKYVRETFKLNQKNIIVKYLIKIPRNNSGKIQYPNLINLI